MRLHFSVSSVSCTKISAFADPYYHKVWNRHEKIAYVGAFRRRACPDYVRTISAQL